MKEVEAYLHSQSKSLTLYSKTAGEPAGLSLSGVRATLEALIFITEANILCSGPAAAERQADALATAICTNVHVPQLEVQCACCQRQALGAGLDSLVAASLRVGAAFSVRECRLLDCCVVSLGHKKTLSN